MIAMRLLFGLFFILTAPSGELMAQTLSSNAALARQFRIGYEKGCLQAKTNDVSNQKAFCGCMADSYESRYSGSELSQISQFAQQHGQNGSALVNLMMSPESMTCANQY